MAVTLSVPELLKDVWPAFKLETPELFGPNGFTTDFSSKTAVLGDRITAKIAHVPVTGTYDRNNGGWKNAAQDVTTLIEDIPVTLDQFPIATVSFPWLTRAASKLDPEYKIWMANLGQALAAQIFASLLTLSPVNVSNQIPMFLPSANLDGWEGVRDQLNAQRVDEGSRWAFINTPLASVLGSDDRVRSSEYYGQLNGDKGFRRWTNIAGFNSIRECPGVAAANCAGLVGDKRLIGIAARGLELPDKMLERLRIRKVMNFFPLLDEESQLSLTAAVWQEAGTADAFISVGALVGFHIGNGGGAIGSMTDNAGARIVTI
jgi:hypothetical protein